MASTRPRRLATAAAVAALSVLPAAATLAPAAASPVRPAGPANAASAATCPTRVLGFFIGGRQGTAGSSYYRLRMKNYGSTACTLRGFPGVSAISKSRTQLGSPASRDHRYPVRTVTLAPHASAVTTLRVTDVANYQRSACRPTHAWGLRIFPPGDTKSVAMHFGLQVCRKPGIRSMSVRVMRHA